MLSYWATWTGVIDTATCDRIIERGLLLPKEVGSIGTDGSLNKAHRSTEVSWFNTQRDIDIVGMIHTYTRQANREFFSFDISHGINEIQFSTYRGSEAGKYDMHHDVFFKSNNKTDRKLSFVLQLSDPKDYEGGRLEFGSNVPVELDQNDFLPRGSIIIFPSLFLHKVTKVTKGIRHSLVAWIEGPKWR